MKLTEKVIIKGTIEAITGLHIGGNKSSLEIGGVDLNVVKTGNGKPFIPGSSLKGKLLSLIAKVEGKDKKENDTEEMKKLFGYGGGKESNFISRIQVRDANLIIDGDKGFNKVFGPKEKRLIDFDYSEIKSENTIDRSNSTANPRQVERVPAGASFEFEMVLDRYDEDDEKLFNLFLTKLKTAFELLHLDYLGGHGTRGSGKVKVDIVNVSGINISDSGVKPFDEKRISEIKSAITPSKFE